MAAFVPGMRTARQTVRNTSRLAQLNFLSVIPKLLENTLSFEQQSYDAMRQELSLLENSRLHIHNNMGKYSFTCSSPNQTTETGITTDRDRIHALARRNYLETCIKGCELNMKQLNKILSASNIAVQEARVNTKLLRYADAGLDLTRILFTKDQNEWIDQVYTPNPFHTENLNYETNNKIPVRSKSEAMIGNYLEIIGLPYRSDDLVRISGDSLTGQTNKENYFADFKLPNLLGGITLHEHFGAFQFEKYSSNAMMRINDYRNHPITELPGRLLRREEITWSFEADLSMPHGLQIIVARMLLPGLLF